MEEIMVSICCLVYNHEKYLRDCLEGFINQKTNFKFEILIHDDASTDLSTKIIKKYEEKYPDIIKPIYQKENQYSKGVKISWKYQYPRARGKYIALCEGDDYWSDDRKLQKQFDVMEKNPDCVFSTHKVEKIYEDGTPMQEYIPLKEMNSGKIRQIDFIKFLFTQNINTFQTSSYFFRNECIKCFNNEIPEFIKIATVGDRPLMMYMASLGNIYYINESMSRYRVGSIGSWTLKLTKDDRQKKYYENSIVYSDEYNKYTGYKYNEYILKRKKENKFNIYLYEANIKKLYSTDYIKLFSELSLKRRIYYTMIGIFPGLKQVYKWLKEIKPSE